MERYELASTVTQTIDRSLTKRYSHLEKLYFLFLFICSFTERYNTYIVNLVDSYRFQKEALQPRFGSSATNDATILWLAILWLFVIVRLKMTKMINRKAFIESNLGGKLF